MPFANPSSFVPFGTTPRFRAPPPGLERARDGTWSARLTVELTTRTPLFIPDHDPAKVTTREIDGKRHRTFQPLADAAGKPVIPVTSVKGMLRTAFEAVTSSRLGVWDATEHTRPLFFRRPARDALRLVPGLVVRDRSRRDELAVELLRGDTAPRRTRSARGGIVAVPVMAAAWVPRWPPPNGLLPPGLPLTHGTQYWARLQRTPHGVFDYWRVVRIRSRRSQLGALPAPGPDVQEVRGYYCETGAGTALNKHHERLFFSLPGPPVRVALSPDDEARYARLIANYRDQEMMQHTPAQQAARHVTGDLGAEGRLQPGSLVYVELDDGGAVRRVFPVQISRDEYDVPPGDLLPLHMRPGGEPAMTSAAERVFGFVREDDGLTGSQAGRVRITPPTLLASRVGGPWGRFECPMPLAILASPKPANARFYSASDQAGTPMGQSERRNAYRQGTGLRGFKMYQYERVLAEPGGAAYWTWAEQHADGWDFKMTPQQTQGCADRWPEYLAPNVIRIVNNREVVQPDRLRSDQNISITGWVAPGTTFTFPLDVEDVSGEELGALLWLLSRPGCLRLGHGRPLQLGCVHLRVAPDSPVWSAEQKRARFRSLQECPSSSVGVVQDQLVDEFERAADPAVLAEMTAVMSGVDGPVHYPRSNGAPRSGQGVPFPRSTSYEWFADNESIPSRYAALPRPSAGATLEYW